MIIKIKEAVDFLAFYGVGSNTFKDVNVYLDYFVCSQNVRVHLQADDLFMYDGNDECDVTVTKVRLLLTHFETNKYLKHDVTSGLIISIDRKSEILFNGPKHNYIRTRNKGDIGIYALRRLLTHFET